MQNVEAYFMAFAETAKTQANCLKRGVGAVLVRDNHLLSTGYNGTSKGVRNCTAGGCDRCFNADRYETGRDYDLCVCVHAEQNCILQAARFGVSTEHSIIYTTLAPCLGCLKESVNAGVEGIIYRDDWIVPLEQLDSYQKMAGQLSIFKGWTPTGVQEDKKKEGYGGTFG